MILDEEIIAAFQATQLLLVFVTVFFGLRYRQIKDQIKVPISRNDDDKNTLDKKLVKMLKYDCGVLLVLTFITSAIFTPLFWQVCSSAIDYFKNNYTTLHYNFIQTSFFFIMLMIYGFFFWSIFLTHDLCKYKKGANPQQGLLCKVIDGIAKICSKLKKILNRFTNILKKIRS